MIFFSCLVMFVMAALFDLIWLKIQYRSFERQVSSNGLSMARMLAETVKIGVFSENEVELAGPVSAVLNQETIEAVWIYNSDDDLLYTRGKGEGDLDREGENGSDFSSMRESLARQGYASRQDENSFFFCWPVSFEMDMFDGEFIFFDNGQQVASEVIGYVALEMSKRGFDKEKRQIFLVSGAIVLIFLLFGFIFATFTIRQLTVPLRQLLSRVQAGKHGADADDIGLLAETYTSMIEDLDHSFKVIRELKDGLEEKVASRTRELARANDDLGSRQRRLEESNGRLTETLARLREAQDQLVQSEKMVAVGQLVAGVAHEINNTINFVSGAVPSLKRCLADVGELIASYDALEAGGREEERRRHLLDIRQLKKDIEFDELFANIDTLLVNMEEGTERTIRLVGDLKIFSRQDAEKMAQADLNAVLDTTLRYVNRNDMSGIELVRDFGDICPVNCLPGRLSQVFLNICNNAVQAMEGKGRLTLRTWQQDGRVHVTIADTGPGIEQDILSKIFDPFFTTKEVGKGSGLGLGISYSIVSQHGGEIKVDSTVGKGTLFEVILPVGE